MMMKSSKKMNTKVLTILRSAYGDLASLHDWCQSVLLSCNNPDFSVLKETDGNRYKEFLNNTLIGTPSDVNWSGTRVSFTNSVTQHELLIQAIEMSSNPSAQVCMSRSFEYVFPNQSINVLSQSQWKTLLIRIGDDLMLHLLSTRAVFIPLNASCYIQLTGTPLYDCWSFLRNVKITFPGRPKSYHHRNVHKYLRKKKLKGCKHVGRRNNSSTIKENVDPKACSDNRKRKRSSQASSSAGSLSKGSGVKRQCIRDDVSPWRCGGVGGEVLTRSQQDLNDAFFELDQELELSDEIKQENQVPYIPEESLYMTAMECPSYLVDEPIKETSENMLMCNNNIPDLDSNKVHSTNVSQLEHEEMINYEDHYKVMEVNNSSKENEGITVLMDPSRMFSVKAESSETDLNIEAGSHGDMGVKHTNDSLKDDIGNQNDKDRVTIKVKGAEISELTDNVTVNEGCTDASHCRPDVAKENRIRNIKKRRAKKEEKKLREKNTDNAQEKINPGDSNPALPQCDFQPYVYHTYFRRTQLLYSKSLRETVPSNSLLVKGGECSTVAVELVQEVVQSKVCGVCEEENNIKQLKCRELIEERLQRILEQLLVNHRNICYKKILSQFMPLPKMTACVQNLAKDFAHQNTEEEILINKDELQHQSCQAGHEHKDSVDGNPVKVAKVTEKDGSKDLSIQELLGCYTEPRKMYLFIRRLLKKVLPRQLLCSQKNEQVLLKGIQKLLSLGKFERCCLGEITSKIKTKDIKWFPRKLPHVAKEFLVAKVVHWIMDKFVFVILRSFFYITDSSVYRNRLFYYRKAVWSRLRKIAVQRYTSSGMLLEIPATEAQSLLTTGQVLGFAQLRLLPKRTSVRPIVNLGKRATIGPSKGLCINGQLQNILQVLTYIKSQTPELMGSSQFGASDIYTTWKKFVLSRQERQDSRQLYFVKVDIENCYDSIDQRKLFEIISKNLRQENSSEEYIIRRFATLHVANNLLKRIFRRDVTSLDQFEPDFTRFAKELCKSRDLTGVVFVDQVMHMHETNDHILEKLGKHLFNNVIQIGKKFYRQQIGISQGSILSTMLCNSYYGDMERKYLQAQEDELLMRQVDDFLLVTPYLEHAKDFLKFMKKGIPEYNCVISPSKTLVNFDPATTGFSTEEVKQLPENALFPWCGMLINPRTLEVMMDYTRCYGLKMTDIVSFDLTQKIGQTIQAKLFRGLTCRNWLLCLDPDITTDNTLTLSLFKLFYMSALKFHAFLQKLPPKQGLTENPVFFLNIISSLPQYLYNNIRLKSSFHRDSAVLSQNALHWLCVQAFHAKLSIHRSKYGRDFLKAVTRTRRQLEGKLGSTILKDFTNICSRTPEELSSGFLM